MTNVFRVFSEMDLSTVDWGIVRIEWMRPGMSPQQYELLQYASIVLFRFRREGAMRRRTGQLP